MAKRARPSGVHQLGGDPIPEEKLRRLVQEAVDQALARIHDVEGDVAGAAPGIGERLKARSLRDVEERLAKLEHRTKEFSPERAAAHHERLERALQRLDALEARTRRAEPSAKRKAKK